MNNGVSPTRSRLQPAATSLGGLAILFNVMLVPVLLSFGAAPVKALPVTEADILERSVVKIEAAKQVTDVSAPWQPEDISTSENLGIVLPGQLILTTGYAISDSAFIEMQRFGSSRKSRVKVLFVDYEVNLALLQPLAPDALANMVPLPLGDDLSVNDRVDIYKARDDYQLTRMAATLLEVGIFRAVTSSYSLPAYLLKVQQSGLGWAEPIIEKGKLVGLSTGQDSNYVHAIPVSIIKHFLNDQHDSSYRGFPSMGVVLSPLISPDSRHLLKAGDSDDGIRVAKVVEDSSFAGKLQEDDVILEIDGVHISDQGFFTHKKWGKVHLKYLICKHYSGESMSVKIVRDGEPMTVSAVLQRYDSNRTPVVYYRYDKPIPYVIFGGLVIQELSRDYLQQWGRDWQDLAPYDFLYAWEFENDPRPNPKERLVIVGRVLSDQFNRGYDDVRNQIIETVNGEKADSIASVVAALRQKPISRLGRQYARFTFRRGGGEVILAYDGLAEAHRRMAKTYEIHAPGAFFTLGQGHH